MTIEARPDVVEFFRRYAEAGENLDADALRDCFAETFLNLDPTSAAAVDREALIRALPMREKLFATIGAQGLELTELSEQPLDDLHTLVASTWSARFRADARDTSPLDLPSHFLLRRQGGSWQIVAYLNHTDLASAFRRRSEAARDAQ